MAPIGLFWALCSLPKQRFSLFCLRSFLLIATVFRVLSVTFLVFWHRGADEFSQKLFLSIWKKSSFSCFRDLLLRCFTKAPMFRFLKTGLQISCSKFFLVENKSFLS